MFSAAGKEYFGTGGLIAKKISEYKSPWMGGMNPIFLDIHGRGVVHLSSRYPCFDSFDYTYENRYFHWYFVRYKEGIAMVYHDDGTGEVKVTENICRDKGVRLPEPYMKEELQLAGFIP